MFQHSDKLESVNLRIGCEAGRWPDPLPRIPADLVVACLCVATDEEQYQITAGDFITAPQKLPVLASSPWKVLVVLGSLRSGLGRIASLCGRPAGRAERPFVSQGPKAPDPSCVCIMHRYYIGRHLAEKVKRACTYLYVCYLTD